jgi:uncharacterized Ntn-hydrolase superfamily protein
MSEASKKLNLRDDQPIFSVAMAAAFFDLKAQAFRKKEQYLFDTSGNPLVPQKTPGGYRCYSLNDILKVAHALRRADKMTDRQLRLIVLRVDAFKEPIKHRRKRYRKGMKQV